MSSAMSQAPCCVPSPPSYLHKRPVPAAESIKSPGQAALAWYRILFLFQCLAGASRIVALVLSWYPYPKISNPVLLPRLRPTSTSIIFFPHFRPVSCLLSFLFPPFPFLYLSPRLERACSTSRKGSRRPVPYPSLKCSLSPPPLSRSRYLWLDIPRTLPCTSTFPLCLQRR